MLKILPIAFSLNIMRKTVQSFWKPRNKKTNTSTKNTSYDRNIPYDQLCVSAILSRLVYLPKEELLSSSVESCKENPHLIFLLKESLIDDIQKIKPLYLSENKIQKIDNKLIESHAIHDVKISLEETQESKQNQNYNSNNIIEQDDKDIQGYIWKKDKKIFVVFRGSETKEDWLTNIDVRRRSIGFGPDILVHSGFCKQFLSLEEEITHFLDKHKYSYDQIYFLGHSLGMACATIASFFYYHYLQTQYTNKTNLPTIHSHGFGGPRVGNRKFTEFYAEQSELMTNTWHVIDYKDPVPKVPFSKRFKHIPYKIMKLGENNNYEVIDNDVNWYLRPFNMFFFTNIFNLISPHDISNYIDKLKIIYNNKKNEK